MLKTHFSFKGVEGGSWKHQSYCVSFFSGCSERHGASNQGGAPKSLGRCRLRLGCWIVWMWLWMKSHMQQICLGSWSPLAEERCRFHHPCTRLRIYWRFGDPCKYVQALIWFCKYRAVQMINVAVWCFFGSCGDARAFGGACASSR